MSRWLARLSPCALALLLGAAGCGQEPAAPAEGSPAAGTRTAGTASPTASRPGAASQAPETSPPVAAPDEPIGEEIRTASGLVYVNEVLGEGAPAQPGQRVRVHYTGTLESGKKFDSSYDHPGAKPFEFVLGRSAVIQGWHEGIAGMRAGGKRKLIIPPQLGYGDKNYGPIPANSTLLFEVELVEIR